MANYFVQMRKNKDYNPSRETIRHVDEVLKLMSVLTQDDSFVVAQNEAKGEVENMGEIYDKMIIRGKVAAFAEVDLSVTEIARRVNITEEEVNKIIQEQENGVVSV